jgi:putative transposase
MWLCIHFVVVHTPQDVTNARHVSHPRAIRETLDCEIVHRCNHYLNNQIDQDHRGIKQRYYPMSCDTRSAAITTFLRA